MQNGNKPAAPCPMFNREGLQNGQFDGLTKREFFAATMNYHEESFGTASAMEMMGVDTIPADKDENRKFWDAVEAKRRVQKADALLAELDK